MSCLPHVVAALLLCGGPALAQGPVPIIRSGDPLPGGARVTGIRSVNIDYFGAWSALVSTDDPHSPTAVLRELTPSQGVVWKKVGDPVTFPAGATIASFDSLTSELFGSLIWNTRLQGTAGGSSDNQALYFESKLWIQEGPLDPYTGTNLPPGTRWLSFADVRASSANGVIMLRGRIDDPGIGGPDETILARGFISGAPGLLAAMDRVVSEGQIAPGLGARIQSVRLAPASAAISPGGSHMLWSCDLRADPAADGCVFAFLQTGNHLLLAREGSPSPAPGRNWGTLEEIAVDVNSLGIWTLRATLDDSDPSTDAVIVRSGQLFAQEGDSPPAVAPAVIDGLGRGPALVCEDGRIVWYAHLSGPGGPSEALFVNNQLLAQTGVTQIGGRLLQRISALPDALSISPQEDLLVFTGTLEGGLEAAFLMDL
jgi:hypothetical protein